MKFTDGTWYSATNYHIHKASHLWEYTVRPDGIHALVVLHAINDMSDTTFGPAMDYIFSAPRRDMIRVEMTHFSGEVRKGPEFKLNFETADISIEERANEVVMTNGKMSVVIRKGAEFGFSFYYDGKYLTSSTDGSGAYITDAMYEGRRFDDMNRRKPMRAYIDETYIRERLGLDVGEYIYGLGEHFTPLVKNGQNLDIWNRDGGSSSEQGYKCIPFHLSSKGYGVLVNTPGYVDYEVGTESVRHVQFCTEGEQMDYIVIGAKEPKEVLAKYTALTGRSPVPPA